MPLMPRPGEMAGNIPLILIASDTDGSPAYHPFARPGSTTDNPKRPCIVSTDLKDVGPISPRRSFAVWLPTPTLVGHATRRRLFVAYDLTIAPLGKKAGCPRFQVWATSQPSRPGG